MPPPSGQLPNLIQKPDGWYFIEANLWTYRGPYPTRDAAQLALKEDVKRVGC